MRTLKDTVIEGVKWSSLEQLLIQAAKPVRLALLFYFLSPADFGVFAIVLILTGIPSLLTEDNVEAIVIQNKDLTQVELSSIFWFTSLYSFLTYGLLITFAPYFAELFRIEEAANLIVAVSVLCILYNFGTVSRAILVRDLHFAFTTKAEVTAFAFDTITTLTFACLGYGFWSLFAGLVCRQLLLLCAYLIRANRPPDFVMKSAAVFKILGKAKHLTFFKIVNYLMRFADDFIIGFFFGKTALGIYDRAYQLVHLPMRLITNRLILVLFPAYAGEKITLTEIKSVHKKVIFYTAFIYLLILVGVIIFAEASVILFLEEKWAALPFYLIVLSIGGSVHALINFNYSIFLSLNRTDLQLKYGFLTRSIVFIGYLIGAFWGPKGIAAGYTIGSFIAFFPESYKALRLIDMSISEFLRTIRTPFFFSFGVLISTLTLRFFITENLHIILWCGLFFLACLFLCYLIYFKNELHKFNSQN